MDWLEAANVIRDLRPSVEVGATRKVFIFNTFVVKIPSFITWQLFLNGLLANLQESQFSGCHKNLAKVLWVSPLGFLLIMEKAEVLKINDKDFLEKYLTYKFKDDDLFEFLISDCKPCNWGYVNKRLVKVDYGN